MKNFPFFPVLFLTFTLFAFGGCELFQDTEHCQNETTDSKIWTPEKYPAASAIKGVVEFSFKVDSWPGRSGRGFGLSKVCSFGPIALKVVLREKTTQQAVRPRYYKAYIVEDGYKTKSVDRIKCEFALFRVSPYKLNGEGTAMLAGDPTQGGRDIYVICQAFFDSAIFPGELEYENVVKENVASVLYTVSYVLY